MHCLGSASKQTADLLELLETILKTFRPLFVMLSSRKQLIQHVGVQKR